MAGVRDGFTAGVRHRICRPADDALNALGGTDDRYHPYAELQLVFSGVPTAVAAGTDAHSGRQGL